MNLKVLKWLLAHREALVQIVEIAKGYDKALPFIKQWEIVDRIARIVIPILEAESITPKLLSRDDIYPLIWPDEGEGSEPREVQILQAGSEVLALGIDWKIIVETVLPLVIAILQALLRDKKDE